MKTTKTTLLRNLLAPAILLAASSTLFAVDIRIGDTPARRIAKDRTLPGKGVQGECLTYAKALHKKFQAAGIPSRIVTFSYDTIAFRRETLKGATSHAVVVYDDGGRTYVADNQSWLPVWVPAGSDTAMAQSFAGLGAYVTATR